MWPTSPYGQVGGWPDGGHTAAMTAGLFLVRRRPSDTCEHCGAVVDRVWLVPGDVLDSCAACYTEATGQAPVHEQGHSSPPQLARPVGRTASFYLRADGRRPA